MMTTAIAALQAARTIAVVGLSRSPGKPAHDIPQYMAGRGYHVVGVNPGAVPAVGPVNVVASIHDVPDAIDILNVFRPSSDTDAIIDEAIERHHQRGDITCIWLQSGITSREGAAKCAAAGITYIDNTCIYVIQQYL
ncbi:MAG: CoA-binding protein [Candidatus Kapabacteria bacterium]|nr:CoA-binding protein [Candidatus Kapabacteria bacterium]